MLKKIIILIFFSIISLSVFSQTDYTPYDDLPGIEKMYKPAFNDSYTGWKRMLYDYPINYFEIEKDYKRYMASRTQKEKSAIIRYYKIWSRAVMQYVNNDGEIILPDVEKIWTGRNKAQKSAYIKTKSKKINNNSNWTFLGPKETFWMKEWNLPSNRLDAQGNPKQCPWQVNVYAFDVYKKDSTILYCGTETGYVSKTTNSGENWQLLAQNYHFGKDVTAVAIHPNNANIVYVSAGDQIHKTSDGGQTWKPLLESDNRFGAVRLKIHPTNPNIMVAASWAGLFVSKDGGDTWKKRWGRSTYDVEFKPDNPKVIYGISKDNGRSFQIVVSKNEGTYFTAISNFPKTYKEESGGLLAVTPANPNLLYVTMLSRVAGGPVPFIVKGELKEDGKFTWTQTKKGKVDGVLGTFSNGQGYFDLVLEVAPDNENLVFWGTCNLFKSTDGGYNFTPIGGYSGQYPIHPDIQDMKILRDGKMWVSTDGGMNFSTNHFNSQQGYFSKTKDLIGSDMWGFDQGWNEDIIVGGRYHNGNTAIADFYNQKSLRLGGAESPTGWVIKGKSRHATFDDLGGGWILPANAEAPASGRFPFTKYPNMDDYGGRRSNLVQHPHYYKTIYLGNENGIWKSTDMGESFELLHNFPGRVRYLQISHKNPNVLYADIKGKGFYKSEDGGEKWVYKPSLTSNYGNSSWAGRTFFVISPYDENRVYACLSNGGGMGKVFVSENGGNNWKLFSKNLYAKTKCLAIQPTAEEKDLVYLFTIASGGRPSKVFYCYQDGTEWTEYDNNYLAGMGVNIALPFYRDSKLRLAGNAGVWETPLAEKKFAPVVNPWVQQAKYNCTEDTLYFNDYSMLNHENATWKWNISPEPKYISNANIRNPKVVLGEVGSFDVTLTIEQDGKTYSKTIKKMVEATACPSVNNCDNPGEIDKKNMKLVYVDSQETVGENGRATRAFDGNPATFWHSKWYNGEDPLPHEIQIDLGREYLISKFSYLPRQDGNSNGRIKNYELYISNSTDDYGTVAEKGEFLDQAEIQEIELENPKVGRYVKLKALSEVGNRPFTVISELGFVGCIDTGSSADSFEKEKEMITAYPIPAKDKITISLPTFAKSNYWKYAIFSSLGQKVQSGNLDIDNSNCSFNLNGLVPGIYYILINNDLKQQYRVKIIVE